MEQQRRLRICRQLLALYGSGTPTTSPPAGFARGYPIFEPGKRLTVARTYSTRLLWQGKEFNCQGDMMVNHVFGAFKAGGFSMQAAENIPVDIVLVVQSLIVLFIAAPPLVRAIFRLPAKEAK